jgi:hypothetical protein
MFTPSPMKEKSSPPSLTRKNIKSISPPFVQNYSQPQLSIQQMLDQIPYLPPHHHLINSQPQQFFKKVQPLQFDNYPMIPQQQVPAIHNNNIPFSPVLNLPQFISHVPYPHNTILIKPKPISLENFEIYNGAMNLYNINHDGRKKRRDHDQRKDRKRRDQRRDQRNLNDFYLIRNKN